MDLALRIYKWRGRLGCTGPSGQAGDAGSEVARALELRLQTSRGGELAWGADILHCVATHSDASMKTREEAPGAVMADPHPMCVPLGVSSDSVPV